MCGYIDNGDLAFYLKNDCLVLGKVGGGSNKKEERGFCG